MTFDQILGHERQKEILNRALANGRIAHAYLFSGLPAPAGFVYQTFCLPTLLKLFLRSVVRLLPHRTLRALARSRIGLGALPSYWQTPTLPNPSITA